MFADLESDGLPKFEARLQGTLKLKYHSRESPFPHSQLSLERQSIIGAYRQDNQSFWKVTIIPTATSYWKCTERGSGDIATSSKTHEGCTEGHYRVRKDAEYSDAKIPAGERHH